MHSKPYLPLVVLMVVTAATMIFFDRPLIRGDGLAYLVWTDTLVLDKDINFNNQVERFAPVLTYQLQRNPANGEWVNIFPFGIAILQAPFYILGHIFATNGWLNINPDYFQSMQGVALPYSLSLMIGANILTLVTMALTWLAGRRLVDDWTAALVVFVAFLGTPLFYYSTITPLNSHNGGAFALACFFYLLVVQTQAFEDKTDELITERFRWVVCIGLGISSGLAVLARWQLLVAVIPAFALLAWERRWKTFIISGIVMAISLLPLPLVWNAMFGSPFLVPFDRIEGQDAPFMQPSNHALDVLFQTLLHSPIILVSIAGIVCLWNKYQRWAVTAAAIIMAQLVVNGAARDWWAGESYGMRRMSELYAVYALLVCAAISKPWLNWQPYSRRFRTVHRLILGGFAGYTIVYILAFVMYSWTNLDGYLLGSPDVMINYFIHHPYRMEVLVEVIRTHVGPASWTMPGP